MACTYSNSLLIKNFTGQSVKVSPISTTMDDAGDAIYGEDGSLTVISVGSSFIVPPTIDPTKWFVIQGWYPTWNGYTAQTIDGIYSLSGAFSASTFVTGVITNDNNCGTGAIVLCGADGCYDSTGAIVNTSYTGGSAPMTADGFYYGKFSGPVDALITGAGYVVGTADDAATTLFKSPLVILILVLFVIAAIVAGVYFVKHKRT